jgi:hypothetical protein
VIKRHLAPILFVLLGLVIGSVSTAVVAVAAQPHMQSALSSLYNAQTELNYASTNKGGHRNSALNYISEAIVQVKQGIAVGGGY